MRLLLIDLLVCHCDQVLALCERTGRVVENRELNKAFAFRDHTTVRAK